MSGRAQAANLTGMLSQIASDVGEMGKAYDWTHQTIRDLSAPKLDTDDPKSLVAYSEWARRNGNHEDAQKYAQMATDLGVQQQKQAWTTKMSAYQNSADLLTRELRKNDLDPQQRAGAEKALEGIYSQMNTYGGQGAKYGGTGREGTDYRQGLEERENSWIAQEQQIKANQLAIDAALKKNERLSRAIFPPGKLGDTAFENYKRRADTVTDGNYGQINKDYQPFIQASIAGVATEHAKIMEAEHARLESEFNTKATNLIGLTLSEDPEVASKAQSDLDALTSEYEGKFGAEEYRPYNTKDIGSRVTAARGSVLASYDAAMAREKAELELQEARQSLGDKISENIPLQRSDFPNNTLYQKYVSEVNQVRELLGDAGVGKVNKKYAGEVSKHLASLAQAVPQQLQMDINKVLSGLRKDSEEFAAIFDPSSWSDEDAETLSKAINKQMYSTLDKAGESIMEKYNAIDQSTPEGRAEASQLINQALFTALEYQFPTLYDEMREDLDAELNGGLVSGGLKGEQKEADAKSDRWNRIEGDMALGTGSKYKEKLKQAQEASAARGEEFDKDRFDRLWEERIKQLGRNRDPVQDEYLSQDTAWRI